MVPAREFFTNMAGASLIVFWQLLCMGLFAYAYLPQFPKLPFAQQLTVTVAVIMALLFTGGMLAMFVSSMIYERPGQGAD